MSSAARLDGVRAGAKRIGSNGAERPLRTEAIVLRDGDAAHRYDGHDKRDVLRC